MATRPAAKKPRKPPTWVWVGAAALLALAAWWLLRGRNASAATDTSGRPGPDLSGSAAQQPSGGASSIPGNLPPLLVSQVDPVTGQVTVTDASSQDAPTMLTSDQPTASPYVTQAGSAAPGTFAGETQTYLTPSVATAAGGLTTYGTVGAYTPGYGRSIEQPNQQTVYVDSTGHVTSPVGTRVGGRTLDT